MTELMPMTMAALLIGLIHLDQMVLGQFMISQPMVGGWLLGAALGSPLEGLTAGALLQILCLTELPVGASVPPDGSLAGLIGTALYLTSPRPYQWSGPAFLGLIVILFFPMAYAARYLEIAIRRSNRRWTTAVKEMVSEGRYGTAQLACLGGVPLFFLKAFGFSWLTLWLLGTISAAAPPWTAVMAGPAVLVARLTPFAGLGIIAARQGRPRVGAFVVCGFFLGALLSWKVM